MTSQLEKLKYDVKYTALSYADFALSVPILLADAAIRGDARDRMHKESPTYRAREQLRERHDTRPGSTYIGNNLIALPAFYFSGPPVAEWTGAQLHESFPQMSQAWKFIIDGAATITAQMAVAYTVFQGTDAYNNPEKYRVDGRFSPLKFAKEYWKTVKAFISFDIPYISGKTGGQALLLARGHDPGIASKLFDNVATPLWYAVMIPLGIRWNLIDNRETRRRRAEQTLDAIIGTAPELAD